MENFFINCQNTINYKNKVFEKDYQAFVKQEELITEEQIKNVKPI